MTPWPHSMTSRVQFPDGREAEGVCHRVGSGDLCTCIHFFCARTTAGGPRSRICSGRRSRAIRRFCLSSDDRRDGHSLPATPSLRGLHLLPAAQGFDIFATLLHSPDLRHETNPFARFPLDSGRSVPFVLVYGALCQTLLAIGSILLWRGLLSHRATIIDSIRESSRSFPVFMKAILGRARSPGNNGLFRGVDTGETVQREKYFYYPWPIAAMLVGAAAYRWYLGLEWFGFAPRQSGRCGDQLNGTWPRCVLQLGLARGTRSGPGVPPMTVAHAQLVHFPAPAGTTTPRSACGASSCWRSSARTARIVTR